MKRIYTDCNGKFVVFLKLFTLILTLGYGVKGMGKDFNSPSSLSTDYFRSKTTGNWNATSSWESSPDNITWTNATLIPTSASSGINIQATHIITIPTAVTASVDQTIISGSLYINGATAVLAIADGAGDDITITNGGILKTFGLGSAYNVEFTYAASANIHTNTGGKITIGNGAALGGSGYEGFATNANNIWDDGAICEWNSTGTFAASNVNWFLAAATTKPILRVSAIMLGSPGGGSPTVINGILEVNASFGFASGGTKTFRDGIIGTATLTLPNSIGTATISNAGAILGGNGLRLVLNKRLNISSGITVTSGSTVYIDNSSASDIANNGTGTFFVDNSAIFDIGSDAQITNALGAVVSVLGTFRTSNINGVGGAGSSVPSASATKFVIQSGSTIEYNATVNQAITGTGVLGQTYFNITFSGTGGTKTPTNAIDISTVGAVKITGGCNVDASTNNIGPSSTPNTTAFSMDGTGVFILGTTGSGRALPWMEGVYNLTSGVIRYASASAQSIRSKVYQNIEITGLNVGNSSGNITLNALGTFTVKPNGVFTINDNTIAGPSGTQTVTVEGSGTFRTGNNKGFNGYTISYFPTLSSSINVDVENITLQTNSTVEYSRSNPPLTNGDQLITNANSLQYQNLILSGTGTKTAPATDLTILGNFSTTGSPTFDALTNSSRVVFAGTGGQAFTSTAFTDLIFYNVSKTSTGSLTVNSNFGVLNELNLSTTAGLLLNTGDIIMRSSATRTAYITNLGVTGAGVTATNITYGITTGRFVIERFLQAIKSWRLLATPVEIASSPSINASWREGEALGTYTANGYGTRITGPVGMDQITQRYSMKSFNGVSNAYNEINTSAKLALPIANEEGYYIFVRGDRGIDTAAAIPAGVTNLRIKGKLRTGDQTFTAPPATGPTDGFKSVGNPFASQISFKTATKSVGLEKSFTIWNPTAGFYGVGRYIQYVENVSGDYVNAGNTLNTIESGQAFFIQSAVGSTGNIIIKESDKLTGSNLVSRTGNQNRNGVTNPTLEINLHARNNNITETLLDNVVLNFDANYSNGFDNNDVRKIMNATDNLSIKNGSFNLILERKNIISATDTIFLNLASTRIAPYRFEIDPSILSNTSLNAFLKDKYLQTETTVSLTAVTNINFDITSDAASKAADRFMIVFKQAAIVNFTTIAATRNADKTITVNWGVQNERNVNTYSIEHSNDGINFDALTTQTALANGNNNTYSKLDANATSASNWYRIKANIANGLAKYSGIAMVGALPVNNTIAIPSITVNPNPVQDKMVQVNFTNKAGTYQVTLVTSEGRVVYKNNIIITSANVIKTLALGKGIAAGQYQLTITAANGEKEFINVAVL